MSRKSGCKIEPMASGGHELTYFGSFCECIGSQTLKIRSDDDFADIIFCLDDYYVKNIEPKTSDP